MTDGSFADVRAPAAGLHHVLYPYAGREAFLPGMLSFISEAKRGGETVVVAVPEPQERLLRAELPADAPVSFMNLAALGRNPARLIPAWQEWIGQRTRDGQAVRGIGESTWSAASGAQAAELRYHEWLLNRAFARSPAWWLLCPYDTAGQDPEALRAVAQCHPLLWRDGAHVPCEDYLDGPYAFEELSDPCDAGEDTVYHRGDLAAVRAKVAECAVAHGLHGSRLRELLVAVSEVATNSIVHGGGSGTLRVWAQGGSLICDFRDSGVMDDPLAGRNRPSAQQIGGRGLWLVHQLCDLVEIRSWRPDGTRVRLHVDLPVPHPCA